MRKTVAIVLGGGQGSRLFPLTLHRTKPSISIGGKYRLIDIPVSNCINSDITKIYILTQFNSHSLHSHIHSTYKFDLFSDKFVKLLAAEQSFLNKDWYQGTADAVRKNIIHLEVSTKPKDLILILSGDQLYKMNFQKMIKHHIESSSKLTLAATQVTQEKASEYGLLQTNSKNEITHFIEKPQTPELQKPFLRENNTFLASMGIYIFERDTLFELLQTSKGDDFGTGIITLAIQTKKTSAYTFDGYWEDLGTIKSFYDANLKIASNKISFDLDGIYTRPRFLPPTFIENTLITRSMISDGCSILSGKIEDSVIGLRCQIDSNSSIKKSVIIGADFYDKKSTSSFGIGKNVSIERAIIDKNTTIGDNVKICGDENLKNTSQKLYSIRDGIIVIPKGTSIPENTQIP
ncbi:glucose-1-phosphate adenylyltransferase [PVC group bacterium (ex Bugula neritina AB1)]|nr:glucose-1-phosphate adenylyltransferase [PVC group bacterium (ex Bugula neritina AB1)]